MVWCTSPPEYIKHMKESYSQRSYLGIREHRCKYCNAIFWFEERNKDKNKHNRRDIIYSNCCKYGQIKIPPFKDPPEFLARLLDYKGDSLARHFFTKNKNIIVYLLLL